MFSQQSACLKSLKIRFQSPAHILKERREKKRKEGGKLGLVKCLVIAVLGRQRQKLL